MNAERLIQIFAIGETVAVELKLCSRNATRLILMIE